MINIFLVVIGYLVGMGLCYIAGYSFGFADGMKRQIDRRLRRIEKNAPNNQA